MLFILNLMYLKCAPEGIRTPNLLIRSQMLYPLSYGRSNEEELYRTTRCNTNTLLNGKKSFSIPQSTGPPTRNS